MSTVIRHREDRWGLGNKKSKKVKVLYRSIVPTKKDEDDIGQVDMSIMLTS